MHIIEIVQGHKKYNCYVPEDLSECDQRQYIEVAALILSYRLGELDYETFRIHAIYKLMNMVAKNPEANDVYKLSRVWQLSQLVDTFFDDVNGEKVIKQYYTHNPIPKFRGSLFNYYGPSDEFENVTFGEYIDALEAYIDFNQTGETHYLYKLMAIMYRKRALFRTKIDKRERYNNVDVERRAHLFRHQHAGIVYGFYLYFASFQKYLSQAKLFIEGKEIDLALLYENKSKTPESKIPGVGMRSILFGFSESGVFGDYEKTRNVPLWVIFLRMYDIVKRNADQEAANKPKK